MADERGQDSSWFSDLLLRESDSGYRAAAEWRRTHGVPDLPRPMAAAVAFAAMLLLGVGIAAVAGLVQKTAPAAAETRTNLLERVQTLQAQSAAWTQANREQRSANEALADLTLPDLDNQLAAQFKSAKVLGGFNSVTGNGLRIQLAEIGSPSVNKPSNFVMDLDIQMIANGLFLSGAKAVSVNGLRITAATSIRNAGVAILIDFQPIATPYTIKAIGGPKLPRKFNRSDAAYWIDDLVDNYPISVDVRKVTKIKMPAGTMPTVEYAQKAEQ